MNQDLINKLSKIKAIIDISTVTDIQPSKDYIRRYYKINKLAYSFFHNFSDQVHMGISRDGQYKKSDLLEDARFIEKYISKLNARYILDLATGRGATSSYLAIRHPDVQFHGIDISEGQLELAFNKAKRIPNYHPIQGDYHDLTVYQDKQFDIVFIIEALCHSLEKERVLKEVSHILKPNGVFIIFDGYLKKTRKELTREELIAVKLTEKSMAVSEFENYSDFKRKINLSLFNIISEEDASQLIMPTLRKFEKLAKSFFNHPKLGKIISKLFPKEFIYNAVAGYLMPELISSRIAGYYITILKPRAHQKP